MKKTSFLLLLLLAVLGGLAGCGKNAYLERNVDYVSDEILLEQEVVLKDNLAKTKAIYEEALRSGETVAIEGAEAQYKDYQDKYKIVVDELKSRFGKKDWQVAAAREREKMASKKKPAAPAEKEIAAEAPESPLTRIEEAENIKTVAPAEEAAPAMMEPEAAPAQEAAAPAVMEPEAAPAAASAPATGQSYVVGRGDSLSAIAERFHVSTAALMQANGISDPDKVAAGQTLIIPGDATAAAAPVSPETEIQEVPAQGAAPAEASETYVVKRGDTLKGIAIRLGVNSKTLMEKNNIENPDQIRAGQTLTIR